MKAAVQHPKPGSKRFDEFLFRRPPCSSNLQEGLLVQVNYKQNAVPVCDTRPDDAPANDAANTTSAVVVYLCVGTVILT